MGNRIGAVVAVLFFGPFFLAVAEGREAPKNFSADIISQSSQGVMNMKIYASGEKSRVEMPGHVMIVRKDLQVMWILMPERGIYIEQRIDPVMMTQMSPDISGETARVPLGVEVIDGKNAQKFKVSYERQGTSGDVYQWTLDNDVPVRTDAVDGSWRVDFKNMRTGTQPDSLFDLPPGLQNMAIASMQGLVGQGQPGGVDSQ